MTKSKIGAGREMFKASRTSRRAKPTGVALTGTAPGRGELMRRAQHGDTEARDLLKRHADNSGGDAA